MDPYSTSGYKSDRARSQARAFETPSSSVGFVAPGFPVEVAPPPPPPPVIPVVSGPAAASFVAWPVAVVAGVVGGLALGFEVRKDIMRFRRNAQLPFYDDALWTESEQVVGFDLAEDLATKQHLYEVLSDWMQGKQRLDRSGLVFWDVPFPMPADFYAPDLRHGPVRLDGATYSYWKFVLSCAAQPTADRWLGNAAGPGCSGQDPAMGWYDTQGSPDPLGCGLLNVGALRNSGVAPATYWCEGPLRLAPTVGGYTLGVPINTVLLKEAWILRQQTELLPLADAGTGLLTAPGVLALEGGEEYRLGYGTPWADAVASPGSQPSYEEQVRGTELPRGLGDKGYFVVPPINYPFSLVHVAPGSPPVTVPDVVIEPGVGAVLVPPGGPPAYDTPTEDFERKPWNRFRSGAGVVMSIATEAGDFVDAMHKGLPKKYRSKTRWGVQPDADIVLRDIITHWDKWDADLAMEHFVNNQIEDHILGKHYFGQISKRSRAGKYGFGVRGTGAGAGAIPLPEVHFANGQHTISLGEHEIDIVTLEAR